MVIRSYPKSLGGVFSGERLFFRDWPADPTVGPWSLVWIKNYCNLIFLIIKEKTKSWYMVG